MIAKVTEFIRSHNLLTPATRHVFAAVSGGVDSCVLLHILIQLSSEWSFSLHVIHYNHRTRNGESDRDQAFVEKLAADYGLDCRTGIRKANIRITETTLREQRYRFFQEVLAGESGSVIASGHNRDDNIETFFMRLVKGSRVKGLLAIPAARDGFIRPLLTLTRREIEQYASENKLKFRIDRSNSDLNIERNKIRHEILPFLREQLESGLDRNLSRVICNLSLFYDIYQEKMREAVVAAVKKNGKNITLNRQIYRRYNQAIQRGLIEYCISNLYPVNYQVTDKNFIIWDLFIRNAGSGKMYSFRENGLAIAERNDVVFVTVMEKRQDSFRLNINEPLTVAEKYTLVWSETTRDKALFSADGNVEFADGNKCGGRLCVRFWRKGDYFRPLGMKNHRKLSDFFIDLKIGRSAKHEIPLLCNDKQIIWVAGYRLDEGFKITSETDLFYKFELKTNQ
jgi:tRNA(Ile)-lysidine synthase